MKRHTMRSTLGSGVLCLLLLLTGMASITHAAVGPAPSEPSITDFRIDATGTVDPKTGQALLSGTMTCSHPLSGIITVTMQQRVGRLIVNGQGFTDIVCDGVTMWSAPVQSQNGLFVAGRAQASALAQLADDQGTEVRDETGRAIQLHGTR